MPRQRLPDFYRAVLKNPTSVSVSVNLCTTLWMEKNLCNVYLARDYLKCSGDEMKQWRGAKGKEKQFTINQLYICICIYKNYTHICIYVFTTEVS